jgi:hypothetical protein
MNKRVLFAVASLLLLGACTNEDAVNKVITRDVVFSVNTLSKTYEPITRATASTPVELAGKISSIGYAVFRNGAFFFFRYTK